MHFLMPHDGFSQKPQHLASNKIYKNLVVTDGRTDSTYSLCVYHLFHTTFLPINCDSIQMPKQSSCSEMHYLLHVASVDAWDTVHALLVEI
jgi:hypothetical protein